MPRRRKLLLLAALAVAVPVLALVGLVFRYDLAGWARGEAKYKGKYTGEWSAEIERWSVVGTYAGGNANRRIWNMKPTLWDKHLVGHGLREKPTIDGRLLEPDPEAIHVLLELLHDENAQVRLVACQALGNIGQDAKTVVPALQQALNDPDKQVRGEAEWALTLIGGKGP